MRHRKIFIAVILGFSFFLVVFYSRINPPVRRNHRTTDRLMSTIKNQFTVKRITVTEHKTDRPPEAHHLTWSGSKEDRNILISDALRRDIPQSSAFWNRKFHSLLRKLDTPRNGSERGLRNTSSCQLQSAESLQLNIQDFKRYPELYQDFLQSMECRNPQIIIDQPQKCKQVDGKGNVFLLYAIKSSPRHFARRQAIRDTWGEEGTYNGRFTVRTVFLLGLVDEPNLEKLIMFEAKEFADLLVWDFHDSFFNLTLKEHVFFKWALSRCRHVSFIFKGDDDVLANTPAIISYLQSLDPDAATKLYTGQILSDSSPLRDVNIKYYVPLSFYEGPYPSYASGGGFLFSGSLLQSLHLISEYIPFFPIDDVYSGMCFKALGIVPVKHKGFQAFDVREQDRENACVHKFLLLVHQRSPQQITRLWKNMHSPMLTC